MTFELDIFWTGFYLLPNILTLRSAELQTAWLDYIDIFGFGRQLFIFSSVIWTAPGHRNDISEFSHWQTSLQQLCLILSLKFDILGNELIHFPAES